MNTEVKVNVVELATELAHDAIINLFGRDPETLYVEDDGEDVYTEEVQERFDEFYDTYYDIIISNKLK